MNPKNQKVALLDAGSQYGKLIDRRVRELKCECDLFPLNTNPEDLVDYGAIIISGGPRSVMGVGAPQVHPKLFELKKPILGICYGLQLLVKHFGGIVGMTQYREDGQTDVVVHTSSRLFEDMDVKQTVLLTHGDSIIDAPDCLYSIAQSYHAISGVEHCDRDYFGVQFHPEVDLTVNGKQIFKNFLFKVAGLEGNYTITDRLAQAKKEIREQVGDKHVVVLVSGGVDSCVAYKLMEASLKPEQIHGFHIDTGFMRENESDQVMEALQGYSIKKIDATETFANATTTIDGGLTKPLNQTTHPEFKRKIIGDTFIRLTMKLIEELKLEDYFLVQGTLRPDLIESASHMASGSADTIKTHHNDTELVRQKRAEGKVIEPLKDYHKDEVRELGKLLGLPDDIVHRQPFPGPGLAIRILCEDEPYVTSDYPKIVHSLETICADERYPGIYPILLPMRSVGIQGDGRTYAYVCGLYVFEDENRDWDLIFELSQKITNSVHHVNRVVFIIGKPIDVSFTQTFLDRDTVDILQKADAVVRKSLEKYDRKISQIPVILTPISLCEEGKRCIVIRTMITNDFMTGVPAVPNRDISYQDLEDCVLEMYRQVENLSVALYDVTGKPPGTTEFE